MADFEFKYHVAFSFCNEDLSFAYEVQKNLSDSIETFIYANRQELLAARDGPSMFAKIFHSQTQLVVILYREKYGETQYTAVEKNAIAGRALKFGWQFVILVPMEKPIPDWYPYTHIYVDPKEHRPDQIASIVEYKLRELGADINPYTLEDKISKIKKENDFARERDMYLNSTEAYNICLKMFEDFRETIKEKCEKFSEHIQIKFQKDAIYFRSHRLRYGFSRVNNRAKDTFMGVILERCGPHCIETELIEQHEVGFDINQSKILGWLFRDNIMDTEMLVDQLITEVIEL